MIRSLQRSSPGTVHVWVLCLSDTAFDVMEQLCPDDVTLIRLSELEAADPQLAATRGSRSLVEYYFTCSPALPLYILDRAPEVQLLTYLDADLYFYSSPEPLYEELGNASVGIIAHRYPESLRHLEEFGVYNVGWLTFRRTDAGLTVLRTWREECIDWCYDRVEPTRFADQKYLDRWPRDFPEVVTLSHPGANVAPWNLGRHQVRLEPMPTSDGRPVIFMHFQGVNRIRGPLFDLHLRNYSVRLDEAMRKIYTGYISSLRVVTRDLAPMLPQEQSDGIRLPSPTSLRARLRDARQFVRGAVAGDYVVVRLRGDTA